MADTISDYLLISSNGRNMITSGPKLLPSKILALMHSRVLTGQGREMKNYDNELLCFCT